MQAKALAEQGRAAEAEAIDLLQLLDFFWRRWKLILVVAVTVVLLALFALARVTPHYTATAQVLLEPRKEKIFGADTIVPELSLDAGAIDSQLAVVQSTNLLRRVVEQEKLAADPEFGEKARPGLFHSLSSLFNFAQETEKHGVGKADKGIAPDVLHAIERLRGALDVARVNRSFVLAIAVTSEDSAKAARLANAMAEAYVEDQAQARYDSAKRASVWLTERIEGLQQQLRQSEEAVALFRKEHGLQATSAGNGDGAVRIMISEQQLSELNAKLVAARAESAEKRAKYEQAARLTQRGGNIQALPDVVRSTVISNLRTQQAEVARKEADLLARYGERHPLVIDARAERRDIDGMISAEIERILLNLKNDYEVARKSEEALQASLAQATGQTGQNNGDAVRLRELERLNAANKTLYDDFLARAKIIQQQSSFEEREARVISPATAPTAPSFPKKVVMLGLAGVFGLLLGVGAALALDASCSGFSSAREMEEKLGRPVLGSVALLSQRDRRIDERLVDPFAYLAAKPLSRYAEQVRSLRLGVQMVEAGPQPKVILVASALPNEGKSTLAMSLAFSAVKAGRGVLLVDGDLRRASLSKYFGLEEKPGLVELLTDGIALDQAILRRDRLSLLPAGMNLRDPCEVLEPSRVGPLIERLRRLYDCVIIDSPAAQAAYDAKLLAGEVDRVLFVARWRRSSRDIVAENVDYFARTGKLAGIALTMVDEAKAPRYGAYAHDAGYAYKEYYQG